MLSVSPVGDTATKGLNPFFYTDGITHDDADGTTLTAPTLNEGGYYSATLGGFPTVRSPGALLKDVDRIRLNAAAALLVLDQKLDEILAKSNLNSCG